jgi:hypothetical protein
MTLDIDRPLPALRRRDSCGRISDTTGDTFIVLVGGFDIPYPQPWVNPSNLARLDGDRDRGTDRV